MADHIVKKNIDEKLKKGDYSLVDAIAKVEIGGKKHKFYSFATKYCHYHKPDNFAIYDSYVAKVLCFFLDKKESELRNYNNYIKALNDFCQCYNLDKYKYDELDKYLWCLGRWYLNPYEPTPIYYHREDKSPFPDDDIRTKFWESEREFMTHQAIGRWKEKAKGWLKAEDETIKILSSKFSLEQFGLLRYIYEKCKNPSWIAEYGNGIRK